MNMQPKPIKIKPNKIPNQSNKIPMMQQQNAYI